MSTKKNAENHHFWYVLFFDVAWRQKWIFLKTFSGVQIEKK